MTDLYLTTNKVAEAKQLNDKVLAENPKNPMAHVLRARIMMAEGKLDDALAELQRQVADTPDLAVAHYTLGLAHWNKGETSQARTEFQSAVKTSPDMVVAWKSLAELHLSLGDIQIARDYAQHCIQLNPALPAGHLLLGTALFRAHDYAHAQEQFTLAQRLDPSDPGPTSAWPRCWRH